MRVARAYLLVYITVHIYQKYNSPAHLVPNMMMDTSYFEFKFKLDYLGTKNLPVTGKDIIVESRIASKVNGDKGNGK